mgnify:CR=1 FL=1
MSGASRMTPRVNLHARNSRVSAPPGLAPAGSTAAPSLSRTALRCSARPRVASVEPPCTTYPKAPQKGPLVYGGGSSLLRTSLCQMPCSREIYREFPLFHISFQLQSAVSFYNNKRFLHSAINQEFITGNLTIITLTQGFGAYCSSSLIWIRSGFHEDACRPLQCLDTADLGNNATIAVTRLSLNLAEYLH